MWSVGFFFMETERLFLSRYIEKDKADLIALFTEAAVMQYVGLWEDFYRPPRSLLEIMK